MRLRLGLWIPRNLTQLKQHLRDPLFKNAYFLMFSSLTSAGSGFFFWLIAARFYSAEEVGLASAIISAMGLLSILALLGFDISLVRYIPKRSDQNNLINTCFTTSLIFSVFFSLVFITGIEFFAPSLVIIRENKILFFLFIVYTSTLTLTNLQSRGIFVGFRKTEYSFIQTIVTLTRIGVVPFLTSFGAFGIYGAFGLTPLLAFITGIYLITRIFPYNLIPLIKREILNDIFNFSSGNYFARIFEMLPHFMLPIIVINTLGAEKNAYFFIAWQISFLLLSIPKVTSMSLLAEGSHNQKEISQNTKRAAKLVFILLVAAIVLLFLFGRYILFIFGEGYAKNSFEVLLALVLGNIFFAINSLYTSIKRVQEKVKPVILIYGSIASITLVGSYLLALNFGLVGVGYAWIIGNGVLNIVLLIKLIRNKYQNLLL